MPQEGQRNSINTGMQGAYLLLRRIYFRDLQGPPDMSLTSYSPGALVAVKL